MLFQLVKAGIKSSSSNVLACWSSKRPSVVSGKTRVMNTFDAATMPGVEKYGKTGKKGMVVETSYVLWLSRISIT